MSRPLRGSPTVDGEEARAHGESVGSGLSVSTENRGSAEPVRARLATEPSASSGGGPSARRSALTAPTRLVPEEGARPADPRVAARRERGERAERATAEYLVLQGFDIVAMNLRVGRLEIDIVARRGPLIAVVEVRSRGPTSRTTGFGSLLHAKRLRVRRAGERLWERRYRHDESAERMRFDAASVHFDAEGRATVEYAPAAF